jgi:hypothetical protein
LAIEDGVVGGFGHGPQEVGLVVEVAVKLAARRRGSRADVVQAGPQGTLLGHNVGCEPVAQIAKLDDLGIVHQG